MAAGRFAPSPTGPLHLGNLRTALLAWLFARSVGSPFLLRMEDLDPATVRPGCATAQLDDLVALGFDWDGPVVYQSDRLAEHQAAIDALVTAGLTYPCFCSRREVREAASAPHGSLPEGYPGTCRHLEDGAVARRRREGRRPALRLRAGAAHVGFVDRLQGAVEGVVDDFVLRRGDGTPAYNLAVVVDDAAAGVEEVVRGDDLLPSTPRQVHLAHLLGLASPSHAHVPLVLGPDGSRLAKRHGAVTLADRAAMGEDPATVLGWLAWSAGLARQGERVTTAVLARRFDPSAIDLEATVFAG